MKRRLVKIMCEKKELRFSIFMLYSLADKWKMSPAKVYKILNSPAFWIIISLNVTMFFIRKVKNTW